MQLCSADALPLRHRTLDRYLRPTYIRQGGIQGEGDLESISNCQGLKHRTALTMEI